LVVLAVVAKKLVEVLLVEVEFKKVILWKVDEALTRRFERLVRPAVAVSVPVKFAVAEIFWPFTRPEVSVPRFAVVPKRLVEKKLVEVACEVVAFTPVKFCKVVEDRCKALVMMAVVAERVVAKKLVEVD